LFTVDLALTANENHANAALDARQRIESFLVAPSRA
jgi:hypothetical protein